MPWDNDDDNFLDGLLFGWIAFDNDNSPLGCVISIMVIAIVIAVLYYT